MRPGDIPAVGELRRSRSRRDWRCTGQATGQWFVAGHANVFATFGGQGDIPVPLRNYYGTGQDVLAVYRPSTGTWFVAGQASGISFGGAGDMPIPLFNYCGNGRDNLAVFRPSTSQWFVAGLGSGISFGGAGDIPIAADFDGIGRDEIGVYRPGTGQWFVGGHATAVATFGGPNDIPLASPFAYRTLAGTYGSVNAASSVSALDFGVKALSLSAGSGSSSATATSAASTSSTATPVVSSSTRNGRPKQAAKASKIHLHDLAIASLQGSHRRARKNHLPGS